MNTDTNGDAIWKRFLEEIKNFEVVDDWWLLLAIIPISLFFYHIFQRRLVTELRWKNPVVQQASVINNRRWPKHVIAAITCLTMLVLVYPAARPSQTITTAQEKALLIWIYDASESMETIDVIRNNNLISRRQASVLALQDSLATIPTEYHKLLISFSSKDEVRIGLPTFNSTQLLTQAQSIPSGTLTATDYGLEKAVLTCQQFFNSQENYPCEIFLLSDGDCNPRPNCRLRAEEIAKLAQQKGMIVHTISWGNPKSEYRPNPADMQAIAQKGGGQHLSSVKTSELTALYNQVATGLEVRTVHHSLPSIFVWIARLSILTLALAFWLKRWE